MKHKNTPRGGAGPDAEILEALEELREKQDELLESMQTPEAREALQKLFEATPEELGDAAVEGAKRNEPCASGEGDRRNR